MNNNSKVLFVCSSGGHLLQLYTLFSALEVDIDNFWVCFDKPDANSLLNSQRIYWAHYPTNRNFKNLIKNGLLAIKIFRKESPTHIISTGAGVAIPFFILGFCLNKTTVYLESYARKEDVSLTGRVLYHISKHFFVQSEELSKKYKKAVYHGTVY